MISRIFTVTALVAGASLASSQSISSACKTALGSITASPEAACLNPSALVSVVLVGNSSIVAPIDTWLTGLCALGSCSNSSLSAIVTNFTTGCSSELSAIGFSSSSTSDLISAVEEAYPVARQIACLKDTSANKLCVTETLTTIQSMFGAITISGIPGIITNISSTTSLPGNITCTDCVKQAYNIVNKAYPDQSSDLATSLQSECGSNFTDGSSPSGISEIASGSTATSPSTSNAALGASSLMAGGVWAGLAASTLVAVFTAFAFLA
jgi:hypothetical protein